MNISNQVDMAPHWSGERVTKFDKEQNTDEMGATTNMTYIMAMVR